MQRFKILEYALSSLGRRKGKHLSIIAVYAFTISVLASILLLSHALREEASAILADAPHVVVQRISAGRHDLISTDIIDPVRQIPGVGEVRPRYWGYYFDGITGANYTVLGIDDRRTVELELLEGALPEAPGECAVGGGVSERREAGIGDELVLVDSRGVGVIFEVVGAFRSESNLLTNDLVVMSNADVIEFFDLPQNRATDLSVEVFNPKEVQTVAAKIKVLYPDTRPITRSEIIRTYDAVFHWRSGMVLMVFFSALIAFCILAWDKATGISAEERREIGILKAIGWSTSDVLELKFWEGAGTGRGGQGLVSAVPAVSAHPLPQPVPDLRHGLPHGGAVRRQHGDPVLDGRHHRPGGGDAGMTATASTLIATEGVTKVYNSRRPDETVAVAGVSMEVGQGEVVVLKGPSGSGKTSLLSLVGCMARPTSGRIVVDGRDVAKLAESVLTEVRRQTFGFIFQQFNLIPGLSVIENVSLPLVPVTIGLADMRHRAEGVLRRLELGAKARRKVRQLSGGEQQRVAIARALINEPEVVVADEPTAHLDRALSEELLVILAELNREGRTVIVATHDPLVYEHPFVTRVLAMRDGRIETAS
jgi:ABC-type lipoprotein export system ATPase subunit/ABC-type lipoprotein release transport system permease subunit